MAETIPTQVIMDNLVKQKIDRLVALCPCEVMWICPVKTVEYKGYNYFHVYDIFVPEQIVSGGSVEWEGALNKLIHQMIEMGREDEIEKLRFFGHSHVNMGVFTSKVDLEQIESWADTEELDWFISMIANKKGEVDLRVDIFRPFRVHANTADLVVLPDPAARSWAEEMLDTQVTQVKHVSRTWTPQSSHRSEDFVLTSDWVKKAYGNGAYVRHMGNVREAVLDKKVVARESAITGQVEFIVTPLHEIPARAEGKSQGGSQGGLPQTQTARTAERKQQSGTQSEPVALLTAGDLGAERDLEVVEAMSESDYETYLGMWAEQMMTDWWDPDNRFI